MKRIKAACLCQTLHFQQKEDVPYEEAVRLTDGEVETHKKALERSRTQYRILEQSRQADGSIVLKILANTTQPCGRLSEISAGISAAAAMRPHAFFSERRTNFMQERSKPLSRAGTSGKTDGNVRNTVHYLSLVAALYNIVDQIFIANATYLGSYGNAANTVVFPLTVIALAIAVLDRGRLLRFCQHLSGFGDPESAHRSIGNAIVLCVAASVVLTALYLIFQQPLLTVFGGQINEETFRLSREYFFFISLGIPFYMFGQAMNPIIRSDGSPPAFAMASTLAGALVNVVLDPVFIFVFRWGMAGTAVATVLGQILTAALALWYLRRMKAVHLKKAASAFTAAFWRGFFRWAYAAFCHKSLWLPPWPPSTT